MDMLGGQAPAVWPKAHLFSTTHRFQLLSGSFCYGPRQGQVQRLTLGEEYVAIFS